ncbi:MAG: gluconokinase [Acidobacteriota bacterium]
MLPDNQPSAQPASIAGGPYTIALDIGSSSVRALLFDAGARQMEGFGAQLTYRIHTTPDGGAEVDAEELAQLTIDCLDDLHRQVAASDFKIQAVGGSAFWHSFLGVDEAGKPTLPILHLLDTRSVEYVSQIPNTHDRTGCMPHSSYWPAKLLWLAENRAEQMRATARWISFPEYLFEKLFGRGQNPHPGASLSMLSATGLWDQNGNDYDEETLRALPIRRDQLPTPASFDQAQTELLPEYKKLWPAFAGASWFPALGDGACNNLGSGCVAADRASLMVGTTGAMRLVIEAASIKIPKDLWCYRVDSRRFVVGGALSNGGEVFAWAKRTLQLPKDLEARLESALPGSHRLTVLPYFSGERTPYWRADLRAAITGMSFSTDAFDILRASLEAVSLGFSDIYELLDSGTQAEAGSLQVIASGGGLLRSAGWTQMMADALGRSMTACTEPETSCRGAALWAMERTGSIKNIADRPAALGVTYEPRPEHREAYKQLRANQHALYAKLFGTN